VTGGTGVSVGSENTEKLQATDNMNKTPVKMSMDILFGCFISMLLLLNSQ
jgi:hypothetical protein